METPARATHPPRSANFGGPNVRGHVSIAPLSERAQAASMSRFHPAHNPRSRVERERERHIGAAALTAGPAWVEPVLPLVLRERLDLADLREVRCRQSLVGR